MGSNAMERETQEQRTAEIDESIDAFGKSAGRVNRRLGGIADTLLARGTGDEMDPLIEAQRRQGLMGQSTQLQRAGVTGSTADNAAARLSGRFDQAQLGARNEALSSGVNLKQGTLQNAMADPALRISAESARRAGEGGKK